METYTINEAAEKWIAAINDPATKAKPEQKEALISKIRRAVPATRWIGVGTGAEGLEGDSHRGTFTDACNNIKREIRRAEVAA